MKGAEGTGEGSREEERKHSKQMGRREEKKIER